MSRRGDRVRRLPFVAWKNDLGWMDAMKGTRWEGLVRKEKRLWNELVKQPAIASKQRVFAKEFADLNGFMRFDGPVIADGQIALNQGAEYWRWTWGTAEWRPCVQIDYADGHVWETAESPKEAEKMTLTCMRTDGSVVWKKDSVGGEVYVKDGLCYYICMKYPLWTHQLCVCDAFTGKHVEVLKDVEKSESMSLSGQSGQTLYVEVVSWEENKTWRIEGKRLVPIRRGAIPLGFSVGTEKPEECLFLWDIKGNHKQIGHPFRSWKLPDEDPVWIHLQTGLVLTMKDGGSSLWLCAPNKEPVLQHRIVVGEIRYYSYTTWMDTPAPCFTVKRPEEPPYQLRYMPGTRRVVKYPVMVTRVNEKVRGKEEGEKVVPVPPPPPLEVSRHWATSADGARVPWALIYQKGTPKSKLRGIVCNVYAAYGTRTPVGWPYWQWAPLLNRGWAIAFCFARGSGDNGFLWRRGSYRETRIRTVEDFEATVKAAQRVTGLGPQQTVISGASAGGRVVGAVTQRHPHGDLMGAVYAEVASVDDPWTLTDFRVPLTPTLVDEHGDPSKSVVHMAAQMKLSPMYQLESCGAPGVFVLCCTGLKDLRVPSSAVFKWIQRLRGMDEEGAVKGAAGKYIVAIPDAGHGHGQEMISTELAVLDTWVEGRIKGESKHGRKTRRLRRRRRTQRRLFGILPLKRQRNSTRKG